MILDVEERDRRYSLIREKMGKKNLDALIVVGNTMHDQKGFVRYVSNFHNIMYNTIAILPLKGEPKLLVPSIVQEHWEKRLGWIQDVESSKTFDVTLPVVLNTMGFSKSKLGLVNSKITPANIYIALKENLPGAIITDETRLLEDVRMIKSEKEKELCRKSAKLCDMSMEIAARVLKSGISERKVLAEVDRELIANGAEYIFHLFSSEPGNMFFFLPTDRIIRKGDVVLMNTELAGPEGYFTQCMRTFYIGAPSDSMKKMFEASVRVRSLIQKELAPGKKMSEFATIIRQSIIDEGYEPGGNLGHAQGLDIVERPNIDTKEEIVLASGMLITPHPQISLKAEKITINFGDPYLVTENGSELLTPVDPEAIAFLG